MQQANGRPAVLKHLHPGEEEEARGADYLQSLAGQGAVEVHARDGEAILMEFSPGPSLGDLARRGEDAEAADILCDVIRALHAARPAGTGLQPLGARFAPLTTPTLTGDLAAAARIVLLTDCFTHRLGHSPRRFLGWAAARCALSTFWSHKAGEGIDEDLRLLPLLLSASSETGD